MPRFHPSAGAWLVAGLVIVPSAARSAEAPAAAPVRDGEVAVRVVPGAAKGETAAQIQFATCTRQPCSTDGGTRLPIDPRFDATRSQITRLVPPAGPAITWVRVPAATSARAFEVVLAPGRNEPLFAGETSPVDDAAASTERLFRRDLGNGKTLLVHSTTPAGGGLCGIAAAPGAIRAWDGTKWTSAALDRLPTADRQRAVSLEATAAPALASRRYLEPTGGSDETFGRSMVDAEPRTAWIETRTGDGSGEYASFRIDPALALTSLSVQLAPAAPPPTYAAPRSFFVLVEGQVFRVTVPAKASAGPLQIRLPAAVHTSCLSVVLDEASTTTAAPRSVGIAELAAIGARDADAADTLVAALADPDPKRADEALATLLGMPAAPALWPRVLPTLSAPRRAKIDAAMASRPCSEAAPVAVFGLSAADDESRARAARKVEQCRRESVPALTSALDDTDPSRAREAGRLLALLAPSVARAELPPRLGREPTRTAFWPALGKAFRSADASELRAALAAAPTAAAKLDVVLAAGDRAIEVGDDARQMLRTAVAAPSLATRYRAVEPAVRLRDTELADALVHDREPSIRHRALSSMAEGTHVAGFDRFAKAALADGNPRVRAAAAEYHRAHAAALPTAVSSLFPAANDAWPFVRMAALRAIGRAPAAVKQKAWPAVRSRLEDPSFDVRRAALESMAGMPAQSVRDDVLARLDDENEALPVRAQAARTLGAICSVTDLDRLTTLAHATLTPMAFELEREVGLAAIDALGAIHPRDLAKRLAPLRSPKTPVTLKAAADRAYSAPPACPTK